MYSIHVTARLSTILLDLLVPPEFTKKNVSKKTQKQHQLLGGFSYFVGGVSLLSSTHYQDSCIF